MSALMTAPPLLTDVLDGVSARLEASGVSREVKDQADATTAVFGIELGTLMTVAGAFLLGWAAVWLVVGLARLVLTRRAELRRQVTRVGTPLALAGGFLYARVGLGVMAAGEDWFRAVALALTVALAASAAWAAWRVVDVAEARILGRYREAGVNDRRERRIRTQTMLLRRILHAVIVVVALAAVLITIPEVRSLGAGLLASAGLISVIAGLAVQSTLTNVFAGVQLAFTDSIRVGDVVDMEKVFGTVEEITLSNVVVKLWDGRRMVYPSSHFTTKPFENWTRVGAAVAGVVEMDVDWRVPMEELRERLTALLTSTDLWDGRENSMQVVDAVGGLVRIRAVVSARNSGELWDLRCLVREDIVAFLRTEHPEGIATRRLASEPAATSPAGALPDTAAAQSEEPMHPRTAPLPRVSTAPLTQVDRHSAMYTGSLAAVRRSRELDGPGEEAFAERRAQREAALEREAAHGRDAQDRPPQGRAEERTSRPEGPEDGR